MSTFRLARLFTLRQDQETAAKAQWAQAQAIVLEQERLCQERQDAVALAFEQLAEQRNHESVLATLSAYERLDALQEASRASTQSLSEARCRASDARIPYEERRRDVEALRRLEERWSKEQRKSRRRKENREREAFIQGRVPSSNRGVPTAAEGQHPQKLSQ